MSKFAAAALALTLLAGAGPAAAQEPLPKEQVELFEELENQFKRLQVIQCGERAPFDYYEFWVNEDGSRESVLKWPDTEEKIEFGDGIVTIIAPTSVTIVKSDEVIRVSNSDGEGATERFPCRDLSKELAWRFGWIGQLND